MENLYVYADFDWFDTPELVGHLTYERLRGSGTYGFNFDKEWLKNHGDIILSADIANFIGFQYTKEDHVLGFISDTLPDRWGTRLLIRKEQAEAKEQGREVRPLYSFDFLKGVDDFTRMGALRCKRICSELSARISSEKPGRLNAFGFPCPSARSASANVSVRQMPSKLR